MNSSALDYCSVTDAREWLAEERGHVETRHHPGHDFAEFIGASAALTSVLKQVEIVAATGTTVMLQYWCDTSPSSTPSAYTSSSTPSRRRRWRC